MGRFFPSPAGNIPSVLRDLVNFFNDILNCENQEKLYSRLYYRIPFQEWKVSLLTQQEVSHREESLSRIGQAGVELGLNRRLRQLACTAGISWVENCKLTRKISKK